MDDERGESGWDEVPSSRDYKAGPKKPPLETRWRKGMKSPNPRGRPKKSHLNSLFASLHPTAARILEIDSEPTGVFDRNGNELTGGDGVFRAIRARALTDPKMAKIYLEYRTLAEKARQELHEEMLAAAIEHKRLYYDDFVRAERRGWRLPNIFPDPRDIYILEDGTVRIDGPVTSEQALALKRRLVLRDNIYAAMRMPHTESEQDEAREMWEYFRRKVYRLHQSIPRRLRLPVPKFEYHETDEERGSGLN